jgi:hypothetical protein
MNLTLIKRALRGWLPQQPSTIQKLKQHSTPVAVGLIITIISVSAFMVSSNAIFGSAIKPIPIIPMVNNTATEQNIATEPTTPPLNVTNLTKEQALAIATPIIQQYATENNRVITGINANLAKGSDEGSRGGLTLQQVIALNLTASGAHNKFSYYPIWVIDATFQWEHPQPVYTYDENGTITGGHYPDDATWICGYNVAIWADTGEIKSHGPNGVM